jgi:hypothetical protein
MTGRVGSGDGRVRADVTSGEIRVARGRAGHGRGRGHQRHRGHPRLPRRRARSRRPLGVRGRGRPSAVPRRAARDDLTFDLPEQYPAGRRRIAIEVSEPGEPDGSVVVVDVDIVVEPRDALSFGVEPSSMTVGPEGTFVVTPVNSGNTTLELELVRGRPGAQGRGHLRPAASAPAPGASGASCARRPVGHARGSACRSCASSSSASRAGPRRRSPRRPSSRRHGSAGVRSRSPGLVVVATLFAFVIFLSFSSVADLSAQQEALLKQSLGEDQPIGVRIEPSSIAGRVVSTTGGGIDGVSVELYTTANAVVPAKSTVTDVNGTYRFGSLVPDTYFVRFRVAGFGESWFRRGTSIADATAIELVAGQELVDVDVALGGQPGSIVGRVIGEDVEGALVVAQIPGIVDRGQRSRAGRCAARVRRRRRDGGVRPRAAPDPAAYEVVVTKAGFAPQVRVISLEPGEERRDLEILLRRGGGVIAGTVVDREGTPIPGAQVVVSDGQTRSRRARSARRRCSARSTCASSRPRARTRSRSARRASSPRRRASRSGRTSASRPHGRADRRAGVDHRPRREQLGRPLGGIEVTVLGPGLSRDHADGQHPRRVHRRRRAGRLARQHRPLPGDRRHLADRRAAGPGCVHGRLRGARRAVAGGVGGPHPWCRIAANRRQRGARPRDRGRSAAASSSPAARRTPISAEDGVVVTLRSTNLVRTLRPVDLPVSRKGEFRFDNVPPAAYTLTVTRPGSTPQTILINTSSPPAFSDEPSDHRPRPAGRDHRDRATLRVLRRTASLRRRGLHAGGDRSAGGPAGPHRPQRELLCQRHVRTGALRAGFFDLETGETFTIPNPSQRTDDGADVINLEPGFPFDMNVEMNGAGATAIFPFTTFG